MSKNERRRRSDSWIPLMATMFFCLFIILGVLAYGIVNTNNRAREVQNRQVKIGICILEQLAEHRVTSAEHHKSAAKAHETIQVIPENVKPPTFEANIEACVGFFPPDMPKERDE